MSVDRHLPASAATNERAAGTSQEDASTTAVVPCGSARGRLSVMPPPVICAMPLTRPPSRIGRTATGTNGAARAARRPRCGPVRIRNYRRQAPAARTRSASPMSSHSYAAQTRDADEHIAHRDRAAIDQLRAIDRTDDKSGQVVLAVGVKPRHLRRLTAEQCAPVVAARGRHARRRRLSATVGQESSVAR